MHAVQYVTPPQGLTMIHLQCPLLDEHHTEFYALLDSFNPNAFEASFMRLLEHTRTHFAHEESLMKEHRFQGYFEHHEEHVKILWKKQTPKNLNIYIIYIIIVTKAMLICLLGDNMLIQTIIFFRCAKI